MCKSHQRSTNREIFELFYDFGQNIILFHKSGMTLELYNQIVNMISRGEIIHAIIKVFESQVPAEGDQFITEGLF